MATLIEMWGVGENSFAEDPPNAVLAFLEPATTCRRTSWW
jgi:hypothetical protein